MTTQTKTDPAAEVAAIGEQLEAARAERSRLGQEAEQWQADIRQLEAELSELGRTEFVMVSLVQREDGLVAYPTGKGSGSITAFAQADGFLTVAALADSLAAGTEAEVTLFTPHLRLPDLVIMGSHDIGLDAVVGRLAGMDHAVRLIAVGSLGGLAAARRGECDIAPIHLLDPKTGAYNAPFLSPGLELKTYGKEVNITAEGNVPHIWTGLCAPACAVAFRNRVSQ